MNTVGVARSIRDARQDLWQFPSVRQLTIYFVSFKALVVARDTSAHLTRKYPSAKPKGSEKTPCIFGIFRMFTPGIES